MKHVLLAFGLLLLGVSASSVSAQNLNELCTLMPAGRGRTMPPKWQRETPDKFCHATYDEFNHDAGHKAYNYVAIQRRESARSLQEELATFVVTAQPGRTPPQKQLIPDLGDEGYVLTGWINPTDYQVVFRRGPYRVDIYASKHAMKDQLPPHAAPTIVRWAREIDAALVRAGAPRGPAARIAGTPRQLPSDESYDDFGRLIGERDAGSGVPARRVPAGAKSSLPDRLAKDPGALSTDPRAHATFARSKSTNELRNNMNRKLVALDDYLARNHPDQRRQLFGAISVLVARHVKSAACFAGDQNVLNPDPRFHEDYARRHPERVAANLNWKVDAAMGCLQGDRLTSFFADVSVAIANAAKVYR